MALGAPKLDRIGLRILSRLQKSGRITNVDPADAVGVQANAGRSRLPCRSASSPSTTRFARLQAMPASQATA
jgi:hypothetical protein